MCVCIVRARRRTRTKRISWFSWYANVRKDERFQYVGWVGLIVVTWRSFLLLSFCAFCFLFFFCPVVVLRAPERLVSVLKVLI